jgi:hypothetical protein
MSRFLESLGKKCTPCRRKAADRRFTTRLEVQPLEDRLVPTQLTVINALDPVAVTAGTLRWAVHQADSDSTAGVSDTIRFDTKQMGTSTITLQQGLLELTPGAGTIIIDGGNQVTVSGNNASGVLQVDSGAQAVVKGLTIQNGNGGVLQGGGITNKGSLSVSNVTVSGNTAIQGGGIYNAGKLVASDVTLVGNCASDGAGIDNKGTLTLTNATLAGNFANFGWRICGGISNESGGTLTLNATTIFGNSAWNGGGIGNAGTLTLTDTIVAGNTASQPGGSPDIAGGVIVGSAYNFIGSGTGMSGILNGVNHNQVGSWDLAQWWLAPLGNYGGPTQTLAVLPGSPASGTGEVLPGVTTDQRGEPLSVPPSIGAYQPQAVASIQVSAPSTAVAGTPFNLTITAKDTSGNGYSGPVYLSASDLQIMPSRLITMINGTATVSVTLYSADTLKLTASLGATQGTSGNITVSPGAATSFSFGGSTMGLGVTAGTPFLVAVTAQDAYGNTVTGYNGVAQLKCSDGQALAPPAVKLTNGTGTARCVLLRVDTLTLTATAGAIQGTSGSFHVGGGAPVSLTMSPVGTQTAGTSFTITVQGWDAWGNAANASLELFGSDSQAVPTSIISLTNGQASPTLTIDRAESLTLTASVMTNQPVWVISNKFKVKPGPLAALVVGAPKTVTAGANFTVTITAEDAYGNVETGNNNSVYLSASDVNQNTYVPPAVTLVKGVASANVRFDKTETLTLTASEGKVKGTASITVNAGPVAFFNISAPMTVGVGTAFGVTVTAEDAYSNTVTSYNGSVEIDCSDGQQTRSTVYTSGWTAGLQSTAAATLSGGSGSATVLLETADATSLTVKGSSRSITVTPDWFSSNVSDQRLQSLARWDYDRDNAITFADMEGLINLAIYEAGNVATEVESSLANSLGSLASNASIMQPYVQNLALKVAAPSVADFTNLQSLGVLENESQAPNDLVWHSALWQSLESEWFLGAMHPPLTDGTPGNYGNVNEGLFSASNPSPFVGTPVYTDVFQGGVNDCTLMASLAELAYRNSSIFQNMFIYDGTAQEGGQTVNVWSVRFYHNGQADYVTVDSELPLGGGGKTLYAHPENNLWAALAEKAYVQLNGEGWLNTIDGSLKDFSMAGKYSYAAINNGNPSTMDAELRAVTGLNSGHFDGFGGLGQPKASDIANHLENGEFVVMGTPNSVPGWALVHNHAYAVLSYDPNTDHFTLFNPLGVKNGQFNYNGQYSSAYDLFWANSDYLNSYFSGGAQAGTAATELVHVMPSAPEASPALTLPPPRDFFVSVPPTGGTVDPAVVGPSQPQAADSQQGQPIESPTLLIQTARSESQATENQAAVRNRFSFGPLSGDLDLPAEEVARTLGKTDNGVIQR